MRASGESSDLFDADDGYYIARLDSLVGGGKTFDAVQAMVRAARGARPRGRARDSRRDEARPAARSSSLEAAAAAAGQKVDNTGMVTRSGAGRAFGALGEAVGAAFAAPLNEVTGPVRQEDGVFVTRTDARKPSDKEAFEKQKDALRASRLSQLRQQRIQMYLEDLRRSANISDRRKDIMSQLKRQTAT